MSNNLFSKYKIMSEEMKAAFWYAVSNIGQKIAPWLVMIILTHMLATTQYGVYSIFLSWTEIVEIVITLRIYSNGYVAGLVQNSSSRGVYTATMQKLCFFLITFWLCVYLICNTFITKVMGIDFSLVLLMIISFYGTTGFGLWASRQRVDNNYRVMFVATLFYGILGPIAGALTVFMKIDNPILVVVIVRTFIQLLVAIPFIISNIRGQLRRFDFQLAREAIEYNLPLIPYYLSMVILNQSDRLMIQRFEGYEKAGIYSVAYSAAMMIFIISGALNLSLQPWLFRGLKRKLNDNQSNLITTGTIIVAICAVFMIALAPEAILILGGEKYLEAIWIVPPVVISVIVMFIYQQFANVLFYFKSTRMILFASVISAALNIILNAYFIPIYGYYAAGYTTLFSYLFVLFLYYKFMKMTCLKNCVNSLNFFDIKKQMLVLLVLIIIAIFMMAFYRGVVIRYTVFFVTLFIIFIKRRWFLQMIKQTKF